MPCKTFQDAQVDSRSSLTHKRWMSLHWMGQLLPSWSWSHTSFLIDTICSEQKNWTPSIPFWIRLRLTYISRHDSWTWLDPQIRTWPKVQWQYPSHHLGRCRNTYGPSWTLDPSPNWWSICNNSWTTFDPTISREKLQREKPQYVSHWLPSKES
jgi:hypothetical protein